MQISRHWRLNSQRYRLEGYRHTNGEVSLQARPVTPHAASDEIEMHEAVDAAYNKAAVAVV